MVQMVVMVGVTEGGDMELGDFAWRPDENSAIPYYRQLMVYVRNQIVTGALRPGARLPPQRALATRFGLNRSTVVAAYQELQADGLVMGRMGGGTIVVGPDSDADGASKVFKWHEMLDRGTYVHDKSLAAEVARARAHPDIIPLAQGELAPDLKPTAVMQELIHSVPITAASLSYEDRHGYRPLREAIAQHMTNRGAPTDMSSVLTLAGAQQGLYIICRGLLQPGDTVVVEAPSYLLTLDVLRSAGLRVLRAPLDQHGLMVDRLEELLARRHVAMIFTTPSYQNPTGSLLAANRRARILDLCERYQVPLVEDDVYGELGFAGAAAPPLYAQDQRGLVIYVSSISKSVAPSLRVGWLVAPPYLTKRLAETKYQVQFGCSMAPQWVAAQWLDQGHHRTHIAHVTRALQERRDILEDGLRQHFGPLLEWVQPRGGFHLWAEVHAPVSSTALFRAALRAGLAIKPGSLYGMPPGHAWIRLSFQYASLDNLRAAPQVLRQVIEEVIQTDQDNEGYPAETAAM